MNRNYKKGLIALILLFFISVIPSLAQYKGKMGYGLSPLGHPNDYSKFAEFLTEVSTTCDNGGVAFANGEWRNTIASSGQIPNLHRTVALLQPAPYAYTDMLNFAWRSGNQLHLSVPGDTTNTWSNATMRSLFLHMLIHAADSLKPSYLFIGNETSRYWELDSVDYLNWVSFYHQAYDSIKVHSPSTQVGTVFNYEHLSGSGRLTGFNTSYWQALNAHDTSKIDILGLTVYPFFHDTLANDVPDSYLNPIFDRIDNKPLAITETGWPADSFIGSWKCSPTQQVDYVEKLFKLVANRNVEVINWLFLHYSINDGNNDGDKIFRSVSMRDSTGADQPALKTWLAQCYKNQSVLNTIDKDLPFSLYPNPAYGSVSVKHKQKINSIRLYNTQGQLVYQVNEVKALSKEIVLHSLSKGVYICQIQNSSGHIYNQKLLIE